MTRRLVACRVGPAYIGVIAMLIAATGAVTPAHAGRPAVQGESRAVAGYYRCVDAQLLKREKGRLAADAIADDILAACRQRRAALVRDAAARLRAGPSVLSASEAQQRGEDIAQLHDRMHRNYILGAIMEYRAKIAPGGTQAGQ